VVGFIPQYRAASSRVSNGSGLTKVELVMAHVEDYGGSKTTVALADWVPACALIR
jgi:hypothetical protein